MRTIIEIAQYRGSAAKTRPGAWKYLLAHLPAPVVGRDTSTYHNGPDAAARWRAAKQERTADGRARILGYDLNDPNTPGNIQTRATSDNNEWDRRRETVLYRDYYGAIYGRHVPRTWDGHTYTFPLPRPDTDYWAALNLIADAAKIGAIPAAYDSIDFDRKGRADGAALHHDLYDYACDVALVCLRRTRGTRYGVGTLSKHYVLLERTPDGGIAVIDTSLPVAKFAKIPGIKPGQIIARVRGEEGAVKLPASPATWDEAYKALAVDGETLRSIFSGEEYALASLKKERAQHGHHGGYYCYPSLEQALAAEVPESSKCLNLPRVVVRCETSGRAVRYDNGKIARTYLRPVEIVASILR